MQETQTKGELGLAGQLFIKHVTNLMAPATPAPLKWKLKNALRWDFIKGWLGNEVAVPIANAMGITALKSELSLIHTLANGRRIDYGIVSRRLVTDAFVEYMVDMLQTDATAWGDFKFHESGTGVTNPAVGDTGIETAASTGDIATGTQIEGATAEIYKSVGTCSYTGVDAVTEHCISNVGTTAQGIAMDRHEFAIITTANGDSIEFTYQLTCSSGG